jgi:two-component system, sensor histidine kinase and response regulator
MSNTSPAPNQSRSSETVPAHLSRDALLALFESLVESLPIFVIRKDLDGKITYANRLFCDLIEIEPQRLIGQTDFDLFPIELARKYRQDDLRVIESGEQFEGVEENRTDQGSHFFEVRKTPIRDAQNQIVGVQAIFWDVTRAHLAEQALERERHLLHSLLDYSPDSIYFKDAESRFIRAGQGLAEKMGLSNANEVIGKTDFDFFDESHAQVARNDELQVMATGRPLLAKLEFETWTDGHDSRCAIRKAKSSALSASREMLLT